jgi:ribosomal protein S12 methylthiotransferase accessory factor
MENIPAEKDLLTFEKSDINDILDEIDSLDNSLNIQLYIGVIFEENFTMGDFKAQMLLLLEEYDDALEILEFGNNKLGHLVAQLIRMQNDELDWEDYETALNNVYGKEKIQKAVNILEGKEFLINRTLHKHYNNMLSMFDKLEVKKLAYYKN